MYVYKSKLLRVIDGDTIDALIDLGFDIHVKKRIRLEGIDAWETRTRDLEEKKKGVAAKQWLENILHDHENIFKLKSSGIGKFGRCIGVILIEQWEVDGTTTDININELLISEGHAKIYQK